MKYPLSLRYCIIIVTSLSTCSTKTNIQDDVESLEEEINKIELRLVQKTQEYVLSAQRLSALRKLRYQELCRKMFAQLIITLQKKGFSPSQPSQSSQACSMGASLNTPEQYVIVIVDPKEAIDKHIGEAASSWINNPFLEMSSPCIFITLPSPGEGNKLATRYLSSRGELGPLLAHEIGHLWKFHDHELSRYIDHCKTHLCIATGITVSALIMSLLAYNKCRTTHNGHAQTIEVATTALLAGAAIMTTGLTMLYAHIKQFCRRQELEADQFVTALEEKGIQQFITTLVRWHLNEQLRDFLEPVQWLCRPFSPLKKVVFYIKRRLLGTHPSHEKRLFHLIVAWYSLKVRELSPETTLSHEEAIAQIKDSIVKSCIELLNDIPELQVKNIPTTLQINFPEKTLTMAERKSLGQLLVDARHNLLTLIEQALAL